MLYIEHCDTSNQHDISNSFYIRTTQKKKKTNIYTYVHIHKRQQKHDSEHDTHFINKKKTTTKKSK